MTPPRRDDGAIGRTVVVLSASAGITHRLDVDRDNVGHLFLGTQVLNYSKHQLIFHTTTPNGWRAVNERFSENKRCLAICCLETIRAFLPLGQWTNVSSVESQSLTVTPGVAALVAPGRSFTDNFIEDVTLANRSRVKTKVRP